MNASMKVSVVICTLGRPDTLHDTVAGLALQTLPPSEVLIGTPAVDHVRTATLALAGVRLILTPLGLPCQRNACMNQMSQIDQAASECNLLLFLDDDVELTPTYIESMAALFASSPELIASSGVLLHDGGISTFVEREEARALCCGPRASSWRPGEAVASVPRPFAYGCNMAFRWEAVRALRFDENLPLYAWLEDSDFSHQATRARKGPVTNLAATAVHLGSRGSRIHGRRLGFSQFVNPFYLWHKSRVFPFAHIALHFWARCLVGNLLGLFTGEAGEDRPGRLLGNFHGIRYLLSGRRDPRAVLQLPAAPMRPNHDTPIDGAAPARLRRQP